MFVSPGEIALSFGSVHIYYYGIIMALALLLGITTASFFAKKYYPELNPDIIYNISPVVIISGIIGARIYYCLLSFKYYSKNIIEIFQVWQGGLSIHGALIGGLIGGLIYAYRHKLPVLKLCDIFAFGISLGQALGRWGNFFNSEAFGKPTGNFLKMYIPIYKRPIEYMQYKYFHPTFFYESIADIFIFLILYFVLRKFAPKNNGIIFCSYLILYSIVRIIIEGIRIDSVLDINGIPIAQIVSLAIILASTAMIFLILKRRNLD